MGGTGMKEVRGAAFAGSSPPFPGRERAAVDVDVGPERRSPRYEVYCRDRPFLFMLTSGCFEGLLVQLAWAPRHPAAAWQRRAVAH